MNRIPDMFGERWIQYKDTPYYFSNCGRVKRRWTHHEVLLNPYDHYRNRKKGTVKEQLVKVHRKPVNVAKTIWELFRGPVPNGYVVHHKDNTHTNNELWNLELLTPQQLGHKTGGRTSKRKLVYCPDTDKIYKGTREAAKALYVSRQTISDICNGKRKNPLVNVRWFKK